MENRRSILKKGALAALALAVPATTSCEYMSKIKASVPLKTRQVKIALVAWYSQTGNTARAGRLLTATLQAHGVKVDAGNLKSIDLSNIPNYDLLVIGSPVFYYDSPAYVQDWIRSLPDLAGAAVAAYVTFGGPEGNQHNAACSILERLTEKRGVPVAQTAFMNLGTYPLSWAGGKVKEATWNARHLPDQETFARVREYAGYILAKVDRGDNPAFAKRLTMREILTYMGPIYWTKKSIEQHYLDKNKCIQCGACVDQCPANAIDLSDYAVDRQACVLCFGCLNNCPAQAVYMQYDGEPLIGYRDFLKLYNLTVSEPPELQT
ncbi:MAG: EFR1 family ferrodoxin [Deltaproteobacteria bacterium]|nr:EFR1 family ferrodoxin [Deltaproteobacteria bacterium]